ncbi:MAG: efflux RND transporter periplasmic adaptor subunit [Planctomycetes bacterium]|nr:efflux RND transporter periplasmic adaptor subunit [Planctomycetota bacterium]
MSEDNTQIAQEGVHLQTGGTAGRTWLGRALRASLVLVVIAVGFGVSVYWLTHRPKPKRQRPSAKATLVDVAEVTRQTHNVVVHAMGIVVPAREIQLSSQVAGQIIDVSKEFIPGGRFAAGERVLKIEPKDYELKVQQRRSDLAMAQCNLRVEMGRQSVAQREYELLGKEVRDEDKELLLRKPQLAMARAAISSAQANLDQGLLNLGRTEVIAPFNAMVKSRNVTVGSQIGIGTALASLVGTDEYWVQLSIPLDKLRWIDIPNTDGDGGSTVRVYCESGWGPDAFRVGKVKRLMTSLEPQGRMAQLLLVVKDPLGLDSDSPQPLRMLLDSYVRVEIEGRNLEDTVRIDRAALHDGNCVWVMQPGNTLDIRNVDIAWSGNEHVYVSDGLDEGDMLITSDIAAPVQGMSLRTNDTDSAQGLKAIEKALRPGKKLEIGK